MILMGYDTETTGLPEWGIPSGSDGQPHIVQLAAILVDSETQEVKEELNVIVRPDNWSWDDSATSEDKAFLTHKITMERAMDEGIPEEEALNMLMAMWAKCELRVAHNTTFDNRIVRIAMKRYFKNEQIGAAWKDKEGYYCTMLGYQKIYGGKYTKLVDAYYQLNGVHMTGAHDALADTKGCLSVYFKLQEL